MGIKENLEIIRSAKAGDEKAIEILILQNMKLILPHKS